MNKKFSLMIIGIFFSIFVYASMDRKGTKSSSSKPQTDIVNKQEIPQRKFTLEELKKYNGKDGMPVYVAVDGIVYDVTNVEAWKTGRHKNMHSGGEELTDAYHNKAPKSIHKDRNVLEKLPKVGILVETKEEPETTTSATPKYELEEIVPDKSIYGQTFFCPVMKVNFKINKNTKGFRYKGKEYYFCCSSCVKKFAKEPEKYVK